MLYGQYSRALNSRYNLNTAIGRLMSEDPYKGDTENIMTQNRYAYGENDPVNRRDPGGHRSTIKRIKKYGSRLFRRAKRFVKRTAGALKTFSRRTVSAVKSMAHYVRVSQYTPGKAKTVLKYVSGKYRSAKHRAETIKSTLKAKYDLLRKKVSCGAKKSTINNRQLGNKFLDSADRFEIRNSGIKQRNINGVHTLLDMIGVIDPIGIADGFNALIYLLNAGDLTSKFQKI